MIIYQEVANPEELIPYRLYRDKVRSVQCTAINVIECQKKVHMY